MIELQAARDTSVDEILRILRGSQRQVPRPSEAVTDILYDTFDWALYRDGLSLAVRTDAESAAALPDQLVLRSLDAASRPIVQARAQGQRDALDFAARLPPGPVREHLLKLSPIRRLLPLVTIQRRVTNSRIEPDEGQGLLRVAIEERSVLGPGGDLCGALAPLIRLDAEPSHVERFAAVIARARGAFAACPSPGAELDEALALRGRRPNDYSAKIDERIDPKQRADEALKGVFRHLLGILQANVEGTRAHWDIEFLHDLRVATRRTRSALTQVKGVFSASVVEDFRVRFAWLQQVTGPLRDLDVYLLEFARYRDALPASLRLGMGPFHEFLVLRQAQEQEYLAAVLASPAFTELMADWQAFLEAPMGAHAAGPKAGHAIKAIADARIRRMAKRVRQEGLAIRPDSPATELHELRKSCKKLRYLIELFQSLYPRGKLTRLIKLLKTLLDHLGELQDLSVQADHLLDWARQMYRAGEADPETLLAMGALAGQLSERQTAARASFAEVFSQYVGDEQQVLFRRLFGHH
ncbi:hypothetical protein CKO25_08380 [Thiocapsa imhoffii]|uniref:CHAD domain-containing protein n=2 Tax=Thiocapsa imhoffii TaxID=382777 RepID=A0A9X0WHM1_9GAMM|nr:hypothetical protein [Thiocapsa imhoffii]